MRERLRVEIEGAVQGVGFRPFVYRLAEWLGLAGWVVNDTQGVRLEVEGSRGDLEQFLARLESDKPAPARLERVVSQWLAPAGYEGFRIESSEAAGARTVQVLPDIATCDACLEDVFREADRRHGYPFTNCTHCGPRWSIIRSLPYDRARTTMARFVMCPDCQREYDDPLDRRFHAQPNACSVCGPRLALWDAEGHTLAEREAALDAAAEELSRGAIVAVKGLGGFHLVLDARNDDAVTRLREKKPRREKPLALMARDLDQLRTLCEIDERELALLASPQAPIVLLRRRPDAPVADAVAPENPYLGVMLPYTPLHHLLLRRIDFPVVATSGNLSDEPICIDETEALVRLRGVAERFLIHDRPIERHVDDSVAWVWAGEPRIVRRARGYAPRPVLVRAEIPTVLAVGGHLKNAVALSMGRQVFVSQHIGDMETEQALAAFERVTADLIRLYEAEPVAVAHDMHPDYATTRWAQAAVRGEVADSTAALAREALPRLDGARLVAVQHHHAHLAACLAENGCDEPALGVTWDGTGYGPDGTVWGGEFLLGTTSSFRRVGHLRPFRLPGAEAAVREPRRSAVAVLWELGGRDALERDEPCPLEAFEPAARQPLLRMLEAGFNAPWTTSAGRLFDAVAALLGLHQTTTFEGQAAMALEFVASPSIGDAYPIDVTSSGAGEKEKLIVDWRPLIEALLEDRRKSEPASTIAARFHNALSCTIIDVARTVGVEKVALTGGCFQNQRLIVRTARALEKAGFTALLHRQIPPNDGGISLGQIAVAAARLAEG